MFLGFYFLYNFPLSLILFTYLGLPKEAGILNPNQTVADLETTIIQRLDPSVPSTPAQTSSSTAGIRKPNQKKTLCNMCQPPRWLSSVNAYSLTFYVQKRKKRMSFLFYVVSYLNHKTLFHNRHKQAVHKDHPDVVNDTDYQDKLLKCSYNGCDFATYNLYQYKSHNAHKHNIGMESEMHRCSECDYVCFELGRFKVF